MSRPRRPTSVRIRILAAVLLTTLLGMIGAGTTSYLLARHAAHDGISKALGQENEEIKTVIRVAQEGIESRPIEGPSDLLSLAIKSAVPDPDEAILGLVNGSVAWVPDSDDTFQRTLAADQELVSAAGRIGRGEPVVVHWLRTNQHASLAYVSIPIEVEGSPDLGHYVAVVDVEAEFAPVNRSYLTYGLVCLLALALVAAVGHQVAGRLLAPLRSLQRTAQQINETDLSERIPADQLASNDEVAALGRTMNAMLDRLATSFSLQRQMLDDAGHELRTPITIVRGHLELVDVRDPEDVTKTRDLAIEELDRMQRMVEELIVLAKSKRPDFVRLAEVEVAELLFGVLDRITPLARRSWAVEAGDHGRARLDPQRITQALLQLVANAIRFTEPAAVIAIGARRRGDHLDLWVRDEGTGVSPADRQRIFERFARGGDGTYATTEPDFGAGLGLAIVTAIAVAHHGSVALHSEVGRGSTFTITVPAGVEARGRPTELAAAWQPS